MSVELLGREAALKKLGAIGVYEKAAVSRLDELTACDRHEKIGESANGAYEYYLSTNSAGDAALSSELTATEVTLVEMHELDLSMGYSAFSADRIVGAESAKMPARPRPLPAVFGAKQINAREKHRLFTGIWFVSLIPSADHAWSG